MILLLCNLDTGTAFRVTQKCIGTPAKLLFALSYSKIHTEAIRYLNYIKLLKSYTVSVKPWSAIFFAIAPHPQEEKQQEALNLLTQYMQHILSTVIFHN